LTYSIYWLILLAVLILIEYFTLGITSICLAAGALTAFIISLFYNNIILEAVIFLTVSLALIYFIRPLLQSYFKPDKLKSEYKSMIGKKALVTVTVNHRNSSGTVRMEEQEWPALSLERSVIEKDTVVIIKGISGKTLIVTDKFPETVEYEMKTD
jgi:membrane protein implicated in regulation of membrane protease activity